LLAAGALSVDVADARVGTALEAALDDASERWETARLTALFDPGADIDAALARAGAVLGLRPGTASLEAVPGDDWVRRTRDQFRPIHASERVWIVPSWRAPVESSALNLVIDPGLAFGTGSHPTTRLCLRWLDENLRPGESVLDYGCGSGVLAIAAARLGGDSVVGVDIDEQALGASRANARINAADARFLKPRSLRSREFDVVIANILANPLERLAPRLASRVRTGGRIVLSGILEAQSDALVAVYSRWFNIGVWGREDEWVALAGIRDEHGS
jgi:ribosomal protein L11 methyltransferase